jgi:hypothetical protein
MWDLYKLYEQDFKNTERLRIVEELMGKVGTPSPPGTAVNIDVEHDILFASIESAPLSSRRVSKKRYVLSGFDQSGNPKIREETTSEKWNHQHHPSPKPSKTHPKA